MKVLVITSEWPTAEAPDAVPFVVQQVKSLQNAGLDVRVLHFRGAKNPLNYFRAWLRVQRELRQRSYDVIHAQWGQSGLLALPRRKPLVITFRGSDLEGIVAADGRYTFAGRILRGISKLVSRVADQVIVVSSKLAANLGGIPHHVIPSGLDLELFRPMDQNEAREKLGLPAEKRLILFAGSPSKPVKRFNLASEAVRRLDPSLHAELVVVERAAHTLMPHYLNACDVLLMTSLHEGSPNIVKEALACNVPVVSVNVGDVKERLVAVDGCIVCNDDNPDTISNALDSVLRNGARVASRTTVLEIDESIVAKRVIAIYGMAIQNSKNAGHLQPRASENWKLAGLPTFGASRPSYALKAPSSLISITNPIAMSTFPPYVTILMPIRNEERFIARSLGSVLSQTYSPDRIEVIVIDGMSTDGTRSVVHSMADEASRSEAHRSSVMILDNPSKTVPPALNIGVRRAKGDVIIRVDGHCEIPSDYVERCIEALDKTGADCVGGALVSCGETGTARAIAVAQSSPFGVGGATFRTGSKEGCDVDTLAFGAYRRDVFERLGLFDEEMVRNQDDEFNFRVRQSGGRIWLDPAINSRYYSRASLRGLWRQYFEYGYWKVRVMQKHPRQMRSSHFAPTALILLLVILAFLSPVAGVGAGPVVALGAIYGLANVSASLFAAARSEWRHIFVLPLAFAALHFGYGAGFIKGLVSFRRRWRDGGSRISATPYPNSGVE